VATPAPSCLPRVQVDRNRVIRTVAGLRPYRASGFVVRREALGDKALVHNYGHGGAGITLSWGTSRLAADLGLQGHNGPVAVIGAGIMGLTTASLVQEAGFPVTIYTDKLPPDTTSNIAGGQWSPYGHYRNSAVTPEWRAQLAAALDYSWRRFQIMVAEDYGVRWLPTYVLGGGGPSPGDPPDPYHPGNRLLAKTEHPFAFEQVSRFDTMYVEVGRFLRELTRTSRSLAGESPCAGSTPARSWRRCPSGSSSTAPASAAMHCLATRADSDPRPDGDHAPPAGGPLRLYRRGLHVSPRATASCSAGTFERGEWDATPPAGRHRRHRRRPSAVFGGWRCA
jgi:glycine/D-amino acid oxidase-like deaminating enzyme